jgi:hypothetical protein
VIATIETWVAGVVGMTEGSDTGGYKVPIMVPRLVMKASPGPEQLLVIGHQSDKKELA